jgi:hypothetical protein
MPTNTSAGASANEVSGILGGDLSRPETVIVTALSLLAAAFTALVTVAAYRVNDKFPPFIMFFSNVSDKNLARIIDSQCTSLTKTMEGVWKMWKFLGKGAEKVNFKEDESTPVPDLKFQGIINAFQLVISTLPYLEYLFDFKLLDDDVLQEDLLNLLTYNSFFHILLIAVNRGFSVLFPFYYDRVWRRRVVIASLAALWVINAVLEGYVYVAYFVLRPAIDPAPILSFFIMSVSIYASMGIYAIGLIYVLAKCKGISIRAFYLGYTGWEKKWIFLYGPLSLILFSSTSRGICGYGPAR